MREELSMSRLFRGLHSLFAIARSVFALLLCATIPGWGKQAALLRKRYDALNRPKTLMDNPARIVLP
jgi:hypothetical protein